MAGYRAFGDRMLLKAEAEYRVRCGQSRADVSRELGVPIPTLSQWACQDGWRKKDLEAERGSDSIRQLGERIRRLREAEKLQADQREAAMKAIAEEMGWAGMRGKGVRALAVEESWVRRMALVEKELDAKAARGLEAPGVFGGEAVGDGDGEGSLDGPPRHSALPNDGPPAAQGDTCAAEGSPPSLQRGRWPEGPEGASVGDRDEEERSMSQAGAQAVPEVIRNWHRVALERLPDEIGDLLADDVVFESPVVHTPQEGKAISELYLRGALAVLNGPDFAYRDEWYAERSAVLEFTTAIDGIAINGVDIIHWNAEEKITQFRVMLRPLKAIQTVHAAMGAWLQANGAVKRG